MRLRPRRLVLVGSVLVDVLVYIDQIPARDGDVLAGGRLVTSGGGFNLLAGAVRLGLPVAYAGHVGSGPFGDQVVRDLDRIGVPLLFPRAADDTGFDIGLVEASGHTTYVTVPGAESRLRRADLASLALQAGDTVYVSGYELLYEVSGPALAGWLPHLSLEQLLVLDPGPLAGTIPLDRLQAVLARVDLLSLNHHEAAALSGHQEIARMLAALTDMAPRSNIVLRVAEEGCWIAGPSTAPIHIPGRPAQLLDATGAGDAHLAALLARLALGHSFRTAAFAANVAASLAVERQGPATGPDGTALERALASMRTPGPK